MTGFLDKAQVDITCPKCARKIKESLGRLKNNPLLRCPGCGTEIQINANGPKGLAPGLKKVDNAMADLKRSLKNLGK
ncbi:MAG: hypothetical protein EOP24_26675 [Hyphomicrobiales bacterium]|nr:MAG: hypothetical protein EOP24_26675 [Hyphomicrobiales bacterium]